MTFINYKTIVFGNEITTSEKISNHIINNYNDNTLLVWGNNSEIYNLTEKISPISSFYQSTFKYDTELVRNKIQRFSKQILDKKPSLIIDAKRNGMLHLDSLNKEEIGDNQKRNLKEFLSIINTYYILKEEKFGVDFYILEK